jgi:hypothetical protein
MSEAQPSAPLSRQGPAGIGGYLIVPMLGLVLMPLAGLSAFKHHIGLSGYFSLLTGPQRLFVVAEIFGYLVIAVACPLGLLILLFGKKRAFPRLYIMWAAVSPSLSWSILSPQKSCLATSSRRKACLCSMKRRQRAFKVRSCIL